MFWRGKDSSCLPLLFLCLIIVGIDWSTSVVVLENNGYKGVVVAIQKNIPENPQLVNDIKDMLAKASTHLYKISKNRVYLAEVTIVVPPSWSPSSNYETVQGGDRFSRAEVRVDRANPTYGDTPYTLQPGHCGERGEYIHFTPEFIAGISKTQSPNSFKDIYGEDSGRIFVHEWSHLRYGIFDEYVDQTVAHLPKFYLDGFNMIQATGCSEGVRGYLGDKDGNPCVRGADGLPTSDCMFYPDTQITSNDTNKPSIMYLPGLEAADGFCENDNTNGREHNLYSPNKHNIMCSGRSTWDVVSSNPDFTNLKSPTQIANLKPKFRVIQPRKDQKPTYVLVLDVSGSMKGRRMELQHAAASRFIKLQLADSSMVGMVSFSSDAQVVSGMASLNDQTRAALLTRVPAVTGGGTAIGRGIQTGIKLLRDSGIPTEGALMLLVSDGEENVAPLIDAIISEITLSKIIINTIAFGKQATTKFEKLVTLTGGRAFFFDDDRASHKLLDTAFVESATTHLDVELRSIELVHRDIKIKANGQFKASFYIDQDVGKNTIFQVSYDKVTGSSSEPVRILLTSPTNVRYGYTSTGYFSDQNIKTMGIKIPQAESGKWEYTILNAQSADIDLSLMINSETANLNSEPVRVRAWLSDVNVPSPSSVKVFAEVKKGYNAIVDATVIGTVGRPLGDPITLTLYDNGAGADTDAGDGIYSGYFARFNGVGRYSVEAVVVNDGQAKIKTASGAQGSPAPRMNPFNRIRRSRGDEKSKASFSPLALALRTEDPAGDDPPRVDYQTEPINNFERYASGGAFRLNTYSEKDVVPPPKISDLNVVQVNSTARTVYLHWTSPHDDVMEQDVVTEVRYHQELNYLLHNFSQAVKVSENKQLNATVVELPQDMQLNESNFRVYFAVRSRDKSGNAGDISNWAMVQFPNPIFEKLEQNWLSSFLNSGYFILIIVAIAALFSSIIVYIICKVCCKKSRKEIISMNEI